MKRTVRALVHDVGKYVSRVARNLPAAGDVPDVLVEMLVRDLYELEAGVRASAVFAKLRGSGFDADLDAKLDEVSGGLDAIDALEARVRAGETEAVRRAAGLALRVDSRLRALEEERR